MKQSIRVIGFDDGYFKPKARQQALLVGIVYNLSHRLEGIISAQIETDGFDSTEKISSSLKKSKFFGQVSFVLLSGCNFAGFNVVDSRKLFSSLKKPVIIVMRNAPNYSRIENALSRLEDAKKRMKLIKANGPIHRFENTFFQFIGCSEGDARIVLKKCLLHSTIPEPLRLAHLIASGVSLGQSTRPK